MEYIRDCKGRLVCKIEPFDDFIESAYKRQITKTRLPIGGDFIVERDGIRTIVTRYNINEIDVESQDLTM